MRLLFPPLYSISDDLAEFSSFVEQLEHAAQLLESERPAEHRMALVVLDSLAEVLLFHRAHRHIETRDSLWHGGVGYSTDERDRILRRFNRKVQIAATDERDFHYPEALLDELDASIFRVAHSYRNAAYHRGRQNKALAAPLGRLYAAAIARASRGRFVHPGVRAIPSPIGISDLRRFAAMTRVLTKAGLMESGSRTRLPRESRHACWSTRLA
jgi:hypothetical protein